MSFQQNLERAREKISQCTRPVILFDDDPDGLASFLLLYRMVRGGKGTPIKGSPLNEEFAQKVNEYSPDLVIVLDKPIVSQEFFDKIKTECIWIDHHDVQEPKGVLYINPQTERKNIPTSSICYDIAQQDEWIATVGTVADWQIPEKKLLKETTKEYPNLLPKKITSAPQALFESDAGTLARIFSFNLKGRNKEVLVSLKILSRINDPYELLEKKHGQAKLVMKKYEQQLSEYQSLLSQAKAQSEEDIILFTYSNNTTSFTPDLSNELLYLFPNKTIFIARVSGESYKCSIRDNHRNVRDILATTINQVGGDGGGHEHACGAVVSESLFEEFVGVFKSELKRHSCIGERSAPTVALEKNIKD